MGIFEQANQEMTKSVVNEVATYLNNREKLSNNLLGLITKDKLLAELNISYSTLRRCEHAGLRRYPLPLEGSRNIYYKIDDVIDFICGQ